MQKTRSLKSCFDSYSNWQASATSTQRAGSVKANMIQCWALPNSSTLKKETLSLASSKGKLSVAVPSAFFVKPMNAAKLGFCIFW